MPEPKTKKAAASKTTESKAAPKADPKAASKAAPKTASGKAARSPAKTEAKSAAKSAATPKANSSVSAKPAAATREFDVILYGASSFVGKYVAEHLHRRARESGLRWAMAGRSAEKLATIKQELRAPDVPVLLADAHDPQALRALAARTKAVASTVGPYALYGSALVGACAAEGTDYGDLTAEIPWMRRMLALHGETAAASGARLVHGCGFDSIPSDLGTWFLQQQAMARFGQPCVFVKMRLKDASGGFSGGTIASLTDMVMLARASAETRRLLLNPYALSTQTQGSQKDQWLPAFDSDAGEWLAPFLMAPINSRVVQRTHSLLGRPWGEDFVYDEAMLTGRGPLGMAMAGGVTLGLGSLVGLLAMQPTRRLLQKVLPAPGEGPSPAAVEKGYFEMHAYGRTAQGDVLKVVIRGERDPGYGATSRMLAEAVMSLALDRDKSSVGGGFWTPATAMGQKLLDRLEAHGGMQFQVA